MRSIRDLVGREMKWHRTRLFPAAYELRMGDDVLANLAWEGVFGSAALATTADGSWVFRRPRPFTFQLRIEDAATGTVLGRYSPGFPGELRFADDSLFRFGRLGLVGPLRVLREDGGTLVKFSKRLVPGGGPVILEAAAMAEPRIALLTTFGFYLLTLKRRRAARSSSG